MHSYLTCSISNCKVCETRRCMSAGIALLVFHWYCSRSRPPSKKQPVFTRQMALSANHCLVIEANVLASYAASSRDASHAFVCQTARARTPAATSVASRHTSLRIFSVLPSHSACASPVSLSRSASTTCTPHRPSCCEHDAQRNNRLRLCQNNDTSTTRPRWFVPWQLQRVMLLC